MAFTSKATKLDNYQESIPGFKERLPKLWVDKKSPIDIRAIAKEDKRKVFTETFQLIKKLKQANENITLYFFLISLIEHRLNSIWSYNYWKEALNFKESRPDSDFINQYTSFTRIKNLYDSHVLKETNFCKMLAEIFFERNIKIHQTIWSKKEFTKLQNDKLESIFRKLDKIKKEMLKHPPYLSKVTKRKRITASSIKK